MVSYNISSIIYFVLYLPTYSYSQMYYLPVGANSPYLKATNIKKSTFTIFVWLASDFTENLEQIRTHIPFIKH